MSVRRPFVLVVMGVSGAGKTTIATLLAKQLDSAFREGDDLHPPENVAKMKAGTPLTDDDRLPWLGAVAAAIDLWRGRGESGVITCSALKRSYRQIVIGARSDVTLVCLTAPEGLLHERVDARHHAYMPASLLDSQLETLEMPTADEHPVIADVSGTPAETVAHIIQQLEER